MAMKKYFYPFLILFPIIFIQCRKLDNFPDRPNSFTKTLILAHKAGGGIGFCPYQENTLEGAIYSFNNADGIEIDLQKSRNNTIWLFHDGFLPPCNGKTDSRITGKKDSEIEDYIKCVGDGFKLSLLEEVFKYHRNNHIEKVISLDVKSWLPTFHSNSPKYHYELAIALVLLINKYDMQKYVLVECENAFFLNKVSQYSDVDCYLTTFGDFEEGARKALKFKYKGISFRYDPDKPISKEDIQKIRNKGLKIQLWTINDKNEIAKAMLLEPDYIQTDNILFQ
jgi:glycerophosphoryl diester phosphodiesterase